MRTISFSFNSLLKAFLLSIVCINLLEAQCPECTGDLSIFSRQLPLSSYQWKYEPEGLGLHYFGGNPIPLNLIENAIQSAINQWGLGITVNQYNGSGDPIILIRLDTELGEDWAIADPTAKIIRVNCIKPWWIPDQFDHKTQDAAYLTSTLCHEFGHIFVTGAHIAASTYHMSDVTNPEIGPNRTWPSETNEQNCAIALYNAPPLPPPSVSISGPTEVSHPSSKNSPANTYTWTANVTNGVGTITYSWMKNNSIVSTSSSYTESFGYNGPGGGYGTFILSVDATDERPLTGSANTSVTEYNSGYVYLPKSAGDAATRSIPDDFIMMQNYPNPFNPATKISFGIPSQSFVSLKVFDLIGNEEATLISEELPPGSYTKQWNADRMPSGIYFYRLQAGTFTETKKLVLVK